MKNLELKKINAENAGKILKFFKELEFYKLTYNI